MPGSAAAPKRRSKAVAPKKEWKPRNKKLRAMMEHSEPELVHAETVAEFTNLVAVEAAPSYPIDQPMPRSAWKYSDAAYDAYVKDFNRNKHAANTAMPLPVAVVPKTEKPSPFQPGARVKVMQYRNPKKGFEIAMRGRIKRVTTAGAYIYDPEKDRKGERPEWFAFTSKNQRITLG